MDEHFLLKNQNSTVTVNLKLVLTTAALKLRKTFSDRIADVCNSQPKNIVDHLSLKKFQKYSIKYKIRSIYKIIVTVEPISAFPIMLLLGSLIM